MDPGAFLGLDAEFCDPQKAKFAVLGIPYEKTTTYKKGTAKGPDAILDASQQVELFEPTLNLEPHRLGITTLPHLICHDGPDVLADLAEAEVTAILKREQIPVILGGEHSISLGPIRAIHKKYPDLSILHFDAHGDLRDSYHDTKYGHGCIMHRIYDLGIPLVQVGIRSLCAEEMQLMQSSKGKIRTFFMEEVRTLGPRLAQQVVAHLTPRVFISFDVDGLDPSIIMATGTPEPGGLLWPQTMDIINETTAQKQVVGFDVVELLPLPGLHASDFATARLVYKIIGRIAKSLLP